MKYCSLFLLFLCSGFYSMLACQTLTDSINPPKTPLPKITLNYDSEESWATGGSYGTNFKTTTKKYYFSVINKTSKEYIDFFGANLSKYLKPVPEAYKLLVTYKMKRTSGILLYIGGAGITIGGLSSTIEAKKVSPILIAGAAVMWIGYFVSNPSKDVFENAVDIYNRNTDN